MTAIIGLSEIRAALPGVDLLAAMERAFLNYSSGKAVVPPVGELVFEEPPGDVHIKYGYVRGDGYYVVKIASGFYHNAQLNLPSSNGLMLLFDQRSGELKAILLDEGHLTDLRTAAAGAVAARYMAPSLVHRIGIIGTGIQAEWQLRLLSGVVDCARVLSAILAAADKVVVDSRAQAQTRGEVYRAVQAGFSGLEQPIELGEIIAQRHSGRDNDEQLTVADLTGVATQDIEIAKAVYERTHNAD